jgi:hypothetical protein
MAWWAVSGIPNHNNLGWVAQGSGGEVWLEEHIDAANEDVCG